MLMVKVLSTDGQVWVEMKGVHGTAVVVQALLQKLSLFSTIWPGLGTDEMCPSRLIG
jgi:hypothetical protein